MAGCGVIVVVSGELARDLRVLDDELLPDGELDFSIIVWSPD